MRQSTIIFGSLLLAFIIYITLRGQLPAYLGLFTGKGTSSTNTATTNNSTKTSPDKSSSSNFMNSIHKLSDTLSSMGVI